jgi:hypothetical protein
MLLIPLKDAGAKVTQDPVGVGGTHAIKGVLADGLAGELEFDKSARLTRAGMVAPDPAGGAAPLIEQVAFSGELVSNGVKWPRHISIQQNGQPFFELELTSFEANAVIKPRPIEHTMGGAQQPRRPAADRPG